MRKTYRSHLLATLLGSVFVCAGSVHAQDVSGTYSFKVTKNTTDSLVARGRFVLTNAPLDLGSMPKDLVDAALRRSGPRANEFGFQPTVCFAFELSQRRVGDRPFYGGSIPSGFSDWKTENGEVLVWVYASGDASQVLAGTFTPTGIKGRVRQADSDRRGPVVWLPFEAERIGPATVQSCEAVLRTNSQRRDSGSR